MAGTVIYLVFSFLISSIFVILGVHQYKSKTPVTINTGLKPPKAEELTSVTKWNHRHGRDFIILGCVIFLTLSCFVYFIEKNCDSNALQVIIFLGIVFAAIAWVVIDHIIMSQKMIIKKSENHE